MPNMLQPCCNLYKNMASAKIILFEHKTLKDGTHPVVLQIIKGRKRKIISYGKSLPTQWNYDENLPNKKHPDQKSLSKLLLRKRYDALKVINEYEENGEPYTITDIANKLKILSSNISVFSYFDELIKRLEQNDKEGNSKVYINTRNVFKSFRANKDLEFKDLDYSVVKGFTVYLEKKGSRPNTVSIHLRTLRAVFNSAIKENLIPETFYPFKKIKIKSEKTIKRALTTEDINKIRKLDLGADKELKKARDYFLFGFNMRGMSFVDIAFLKGKNIKGGRVEYTRKKTGQNLSIKLTNEAIAIIEKYYDQSRPDSYIFPIIKRSDSAFLDYRNAMRLTNKKLKIIEKKIDSPITLTTYVSRHTWATIAKRKGYSTSIISDGLGHDSEKTTQIYLDSFEKGILDDANEDITG